MLMLHYTGDTVLIEDDVCEALLQFARALAASQSSDVITIPIVDAEGRRIEAEFLLGPASQLFTTAVEGDDGREGDPAVVQEIQRRMRLLEPSIAMPLEAPSSLSAFDPDLS